MPELRQNPATRFWVVIAKERSRRPHNFIQVKPAMSTESYLAACPFCEDNEHLTPPETLAYRRGGQANGPGWWVRTIPNKFAAFVSEGDLERQHDGANFFHRMDAVGHHEVIIESNKHNEHIFLMDDWHVQEVILAYLERYQMLHIDPRCKFIIIFKNHGLSAGTSLEHPHSQLVATPIVPTDIRIRFDRAAYYYDDTGKCVYCDIIREEKQSGERVILETDKFIAVHPFASQVPFETWIMPKEHSASFGLITMEDAKAFAVILKIVLKKQYIGLHDPDFNYIIHTAPVKDEHEDYFHWHLQIRPRLTTAAGFEMGTGIYINTAIPEETAQFMRSVQV